ncbi:MAG: DUF1700 domain-containing protein [Clostridiales bacterium]|nr:DUF1700 domain-containing protein [Clostridiales bacterium]
MTRNEYLETLNQSLSFLDAETRSATISFYAELLCDRMEDGMTEEEAVSAMESAEVIASRMLKEYGVNSAPPSDAQETRPISPCTITYTQSDLSSLEAVFMDRAVVIEPSPTSALTITYLEDENQPLEYTELGGHLRLIEKMPLMRKSVTLFGINIGNVLDPIFRSEPQMDPTVHIRVPCDMLFAMDIATCNGKITLHNLTGMGEIRLKSSNGAIHADGVRCKQLQLSTTNGRIMLTGVSVIDRIKAQTSNSRIQIKDTSCHGCVDLSTSNARILAENCSGDDMLSMRTSNGAIECHTSRFPCYIMRTSNGRIDATLPGSMAEYAIDSRTSNGFNNLPARTKGSGKALTCHTSNGHINVTFEEA